MIINQNQLIFGANFIWYLISMLTSKVATNRSQHCFSTSVWHNSKGVWISEVWHLCWVLIVLSFNILELQSKKRKKWEPGMFLHRFACRGFLNKWPHPPHRFPVHTHTYTSTTPCDWGAALSKQLPREQLVRGRERKWEKGETGGCWGGGKVISFWKNTASPSPAKS